MFVAIHRLVWNLARHANPWIFGGFWPKKNGEIAKIANFFTPKGQTPCLILVKSVGFMRVIGLQKLLIFGAIQLVN